MLLTVITAALLSLASIGRAVNTDPDKCFHGPFLPAGRAGRPWDPNGNQYFFCEAGWADGDVLTGIRVWRGDWAVWALSFQWGSKDWGKIYGDNRNSDWEPKNADQELTWNANDAVEIKMWHNAGKDNTKDVMGWIQVMINGEKKLDQGSDHTADEVVIDSGAKKILAIQGDANTDTPINTLQFQFLESKIESTTTSNFSFTEDVDTYNQQKKGIDQALLATILFANENEAGGPNQTFSSNPKIYYTNTHTITSQMTHTIGTTIGAKWGFEGGLPELATVKTEFSVELRYDFAHMKSDSTAIENKQEVGWTQGSTPQGVPPQMATLCTASAIQGTYKSPYTAGVTAKLANGKTFTFADQGDFTSLTYVNAKIACKTMPLKDAPQDATIIEKGTNAKRRMQIRGMGWFW